MRTVCCVMLVNGREEMVLRAIASFRAQTYQEKILVIWDNGQPDLDEADLGGDSRIYYIGADRQVITPRTIGALRNEALKWATFPSAEIICHFDSDDWSHPNRIAEQVALLEASGKEAVGYRDMLFWSTAHTKQQPFEYDEGEAWLYTNRNPQYCLGTSLCYWREVWQRNPFPDTSAGEDTLWLRGVKSQGDRSFPALDGRVAAECMPRMIASIHRGNTYARIEPRAEEWKRVPEWDEHCREIMQL